MTRLLTDVARGRCHSRIVMLLEGGYDLEALAASVVASVGELRAG